MTLLFKAINDYLDKKWQELLISLRIVPADQVVPHLKQGQRMYVHILFNLTTDLQQAVVSQSAARADIEENNKTIAELSDLYVHELVDAKKEKLASQIRLLKEANFRANADINFYEWYITQLNDQIKKVQSQIAQLQGAIRDSGGEPDRGVLTSSITSIHSSTEEAVRTAQNLSGFEQSLQTVSGELEKTEVRFAAWFVLSF